MKHKEIILPSFAKEVGYLESQSIAAQDLDPPRAGWEGMKVSEGLWAFRRLELWVTQHGHIRTGGIERDCSFRK